MSMNISGMVINENTWDMSARPAASVVSLPYAAGTKMEVRPIGIAAIHVPHIKKVFVVNALSGNSANSANIPKNNSG